MTSIRYLILALGLIAVMPALRQTERDTTAGRSKPGASAVPTPPTPSAKGRDPPRGRPGFFEIRKLLGIVGAVIATLLGLVVLRSAVTVERLSSGALNGLIEEAIAVQVGRPAQLEQASTLDFDDGA